MSVSEVLLYAVWMVGFASGLERSRRLKQWRQNRFLLAMPLLFVFFCVGLLHTADFNEGFGELNLAHYLFTLPFVVCTLSLKATDVRRIFLAFACVNVVVALAVVYIRYTGNYFYFPEAEPTLPTPFVQRPRASMFLCFCVYIFAEYLVVYWKKISFLLKILLFLGSVISFIGLILLQARIGQLVFFGLMPLFLIHFFANERLRPFIFGSLIVGSVLLGFGAYSTIGSIKKPFDEAFAEIKEATSAKGFDWNNAEDSSMGRRVILYKVYNDIFWQFPHYLVGVGTGDLYLVSKPYFDDRQLVSNITPDKPHNQYFEIALKVGLPALLVFLVAWYVMFLHLLRRQMALLATIFSAMVVVSMCLDSTLGTQAGCSFFVVFNCLFAVKED